MVTTKAPRIATRENWPINPAEVLAWRYEHIKRMRAEPAFREACMLHYANHPADFITDFCVTVDPRAKVKIFPLIMFKRQIELVEALHDCIKDNESLLCDKSRDMGASWICLSFMLWCWLFMPNTVLLCASRKELLVDRLGDASTLFHKLRVLIDWLPKDLFWPDVKFSLKDQAPYMRIMNPGNGAVIVGEAGQAIGRGGRYQMAILDEAAFVENQESVDSALGDACPVRISISTYNQMNDLFHRQRKAGLDLPLKEPNKLRVFSLDWRDHPAKTQAWYDARRAKAEAEGTLHLFAREVDRDPSAAQQNVLIPGLWVSAAIDAHIKLGIEPSGARIAAMDVADDGGDINALCVRHGIIVQHLEAEGGEADKIGRKYFVKAIAMRCSQWRYETMGVGAGARAGAAGVIEANPGRKLPAVVGWSPSCAVVRPAACIHTGRIGPDVETRNRDYYKNGNVQAWWQLREMFRKTYLTVTGAEQFDQDELISLDSRMPLLAKLQAELSQPVYDTDTAGKLRVDKQPAGTRSPNLADAVKICFAELAVRPQAVGADIGGVGVAVPGVVAIG